MKIPIYQVDAFTGTLFAGNPAAVCPLDDWPDDSLLQSIAAENNLAETAFIVCNDNGFEIRWFTPTVEVALCGHATLASAYVVFHEFGWASDNITFQTFQSGDLHVEKNGDLLSMSFPVCRLKKRDAVAELESALGVPVDEVYGAGEDVLAVVADEAAVRNAKPNVAELEEVAKRGVIVTAGGDTCDFVSRFFAPAAGIPEDPVTGSAHCALTPYWAKRLSKVSLHARQVSKRGGELFCTMEADRVLIAGRAVMYMRGEITV